MPAIGTRAARMTVGCAAAVPNATPGGAAGATRTAENPRDADDGSCNGAIIDANGSIDDAGARLISPNLSTQHATVKCNNTTS